MTEPERYEDPALARRVRAWARDRAPEAAPERLVHAVMNEVERTAPGAPFPARPIHLLGAAARYAALAVVIAIGVAAGIVISRDVDNVGTAPSSSPTISAPPTDAAGRTSPPPSLAPLAEIDVRAVALATDGMNLWVATNDGQLLALDPRSGIERSRTDVGMVATSITVDADVAWLASDAGALVRVDAATGETTTVAGATGERVVLGGGAVWVGSTDRVLKVDPASNAVSATFEVPGHAGDFPILPAGDELWVATNTAIERLDAGTGANRESIPGDASHLVTAAGAVWASRGTELLRIDPATGDIRYLGGFQPAAAVATDGVRLWVVGPPGGDEVEVFEVEALTGQIVSLTAIAAGAVAAVAVEDSVWVATDRDTGLLRFDTASD